jgi:hypothetical protein
MFTIIKDALDEYAPKINKSESEAYSIFKAIAIEFAPSVITKMTNFTIDEAMFKLYKEIDSELKRLDPDNQELESIIAQGWVIKEHIEVKPDFIHEKVDAACTGFWGWVGQMFKDMGCCKPSPCCVKNDCCEPDCYDPAGCCDQPEVVGSHEIIVHTDA